MDPFIATAILLSTGLVIAVRVAVRQRDANRKTRVSGQGPVVGPSLGDQVVGQKCRLCRTAVLVEFDAARCPTCKVLLHARCVRPHLATHLPTRPPYR